MKERFSLGKFAATPAALDALAEAGDTPLTLLSRHATGDYGDLDAFDRRENEKAIRDGERVLSAYSLPTGERLYVITEWDRSVTTILLRSEY